MIVRHAFSDEVVWRAALGNSEPLYPFALHGVCLEAPDNIPAGSTRGYTFGGQRHAQGTTVPRP